MREYETVQAAALTARARAEVGDDGEMVPGRDEIAEQQVEPRQRKIDRSHHADLADGGDIGRVRHEARGEVDTTAVADRMRNGGEAPVGDPLEWLLGEHLSGEERVAPRRIARRGDDRSSPGQVYEVGMRVRKGRERTCRPVQAGTSDVVRSRVVELGLGVRLGGVM